MAVLVWDEKTYKIYVRVRPDEVYAPSKEVETLVSEAENLAEESKILSEKLTNLFEKCKNWNLEHDEIYAANYKAQLDRQKSLGKFVKKS